MAYTSEGIFAATGARGPTVDQLLFSSNNHKHSNCIFLTDDTMIYELSFIGLFVAFYNWPTVKAQLHCEYKYANNARYRFEIMAFLNYHFELVKK